MRPLGLVFLLAMTLVFSLTAPGNTETGVFGELHLGLGGCFPQGTYTRYADPGLIVDLRATLHLPYIDMFAGWIDFNVIPFRRENLETEGKIESGGFLITFPVRQTYSENLYTGHIGLQLANPTQRGFFRPRAGVGIGIYNFQTDMKWEAELPDTLLEIAQMELDGQVRFGWRGIAGVDLFFKPNLGLSGDFIYDHVFDVERVEGDHTVNRTSRFYGFTIGVVFMFSSS